MLFQGIQMSITYAQFHCLRYAQRWTLFLTNQLTMCQLYMIIPLYAEDEDK